MTPINAARMDSADSAHLPSPTRLTRVRVAPTKVQVGDPQRPWLRFYDAGVTPTLRYPDTTLFGALTAAAERHPWAPAWSFEGSQQHYSALIDEIERCSRALAQDWACARAMASWSCCRRCRTLS